MSTDLQLSPGSFWLSRLVLHFHTLYIKKREAVPNLCSRCLHNRRSVWPASSILCRSVSLHAKAGTLHAQMPFSLVVFFSLQPRRSGQSQDGFCAIPVDHSSFPLGPDAVFQGRNEVIFVFNIRLRCIYC